jgi:hypothetical protein
MRWLNIFRKTASSIDPDVQTYLTANSITDATEIAATNAFIIYLKANSLYTKFDKMFLMSPTSEAASLADFFGATAATTVGSPTWATTGFTTNGTTQYLSSTYTPNASSKLAANDFSYFVYLRSGTQGASKYATGANNNLNAKPTYLGGASAVYSFSPGNLIDVAQGSLTSAGLISGSKQSSANTSLYKNGSLVTLNSGGTGSGTLIGRPLYIMANNNFNVANNFMVGEVCFWAAATNFSDAEMATFYTGLQTFQTNVISGGRQV